MGWAYTAYGLTKIVGHAASSSGKASLAGSAKDKTSARLVDGFYENPNFTGADGYSLAMKDSFHNGLDYALFVKGEDAILVFKGTSPTSWANWRANFSQAFGFKSSQYTSGIRLARALGNQYKNLSFAGHSLGGGIAAAASAVTGRAATVFNAAGVHANTVARFGAKLSNASVTYYYSSFDVLRIGNAITPARVPGQAISVGPAGPHNMQGLMAVIN